MVALHPDILALLGELMVVVAHGDRVGALIRRRHRTWLFLARRGARRNTITYREWGGRKESVKSHDAHITHHTRTHAHTHIHTHATLHWMGSGAKSVIALVGGTRAEGEKRVRTLGWGFWGLRSLRGLGGTTSW